MSGIEKQSRRDIPSEARPWVITAVAIKTKLAQELRKNDIMINAWSANSQVGGIIYAKDTPITYFLIDAPATRKNIVADLIDPAGQIATIASQSAPLDRNIKMEGIQGEKEGDPTRWVASGKITFSKK